MKIIKPGFIKCNCSNNNNLGSVTNEGKLVIRRPGNSFVELSTIPSFKCQQCGYFYKPNMGTAIMENTI